MLVKLPVCVHSVLSVSLCGVDVFDIDGTRPGNEVIFQCFLNKFIVSLQMIDINI